MSKFLPVAVLTWRARTDVAVVIAVIIAVVIAAIIAAVVRVFLT